MIIIGARPCIDFHYTKEWKKYTVANKLYVVNSAKVRQCSISKEAVNYRTCANITILYTHSMAMASARAKKCDWICMFLRVNRRTCISSLTGTGRMISDVPEIYTGLTRLKPSSERLGITDRSNLTVVTAVEVRSYLYPSDQPPERFCCRYSDDHNTYEVCALHASKTEVSERDGAGDTVCGTKSIGLN